MAPLTKLLDTVKTYIQQTNHTKFESMFWFKYVAIQKTHGHVDVPGSSYILQLFLKVYSHGAILLRCLYFIHTKAPSCVTMSLWCYFVNCHCDGPMTPHQNVSTKQTNRDIHLINKDGADTQNEISEQRLNLWLINQQVCHTESKYMINITPFNHSPKACILTGGDNSTITSSGAWARHLYCAKCKHC